MTTFRSTLLAFMLAIMALALLPAGAAAHQVLGAVDPGHGYARAAGDRQTRGVAGPVMTIYSSAREYRAQLPLVLAQLRRSGLDVRIEVVASPAKANVIISESRALRCIGTAGLAIAGRSAQLAKGCSRQAREVILAHELGHVLGMAHRDSECTVMNSLIRHRGTLARPSRCRVARPARALYTTRDIALLRTMYRNSAPVARMATETPQIVVGDKPFVYDATDDAEQNLVRIVVDWGIPTSGGLIFNSAGGSIPDEVLEKYVPTYDAPGTYQITITARDAYGLESSSTTQIEVTDSEDDTTLGDDGAFADDGDLGE